VYHGPSLKAKKIRKIPSIEHPDLENALEAEVGLGWQTAKKRTGPV